MGQPGRLEEMDANVVRVGLTRGALDALSQQDIARVGITPIRARREVEWPTEGDSQHLVGCHVAPQLLDPFGAVLEAWNSRGVGEQLAEGDLARAGREPGHVRGEGIVQPKLAGL